MLPVLPWLTRSKTFKTGADEPSLTYSFLNRHYRVLLCNYAMYQHPQQRFSALERIILRTRQRFYDLSQESTIQLFIFLFFIVCTILLYTMLLLQLFKISGGKHPLTLDNILIMMYKSLKMASTLPNIETQDGCNLVCKNSKQLFFV